MPSADYETVLKWQLRITLGEPKPTGLTEQESAEYDNLERSIDSAAAMGYVVSFPGGMADEEPDEESEPAEPSRRVYPDTDTMARFVRDITLGGSKPNGLSLIESRAWDELAEDIAKARRRGYVIEIPPE